MWYCIPTCEMKKYRFVIVINRESILWIDKKKRKESVRNPKLFEICVNGRKN